MILLLYIVGILVWRYSFDNTNGTAVFMAASEREKVSLRGAVTELDKKAGGNLYITLRAEEILDSEGKAFSDAKGMKLLLITEDMDIPFDSVVSAEGRLRLFEPAGVPGDFDESLYYGARGYDLKMYPDSIEYSQGERSFGYYIHNFRERMVEVYSSVLPEREAGILSAMITGYRAAVPEDIKELYAEAGVSHILAISGLHISAFGVGLYLLLRKILRFSMKQGSAVAIAALIFYAIFTGGSVSTLRATIMACVPLAGVFFGREADGANSLGLAALILLIINPLNLFDAGFLLSFSSVAGIFITVNMLGFRERENKRREERKAKKEKQSLSEKFIYALLQLLAMTLGAALFSYPIAAVYYNYVPVWGLLINLAVVPLMTIVVGLGLLSGIVGLFFVPIGSVLIFPVYLILRFYEFLIVSFSAVGLTGINVASPSVKFLAAYYAALLQSFFFKRKLWRIFVYAGTLVCIVLAVNANPVISVRDSVTFLDVGQGDAAVIETSEGRCYFVDGGGYSYVTGDKNVGSYVLAPYLRHRGISRVDGIFISHLDADHALGAIELLELVRVEAVWVAKNAALDDENGLCAELIAALEKSGTPLYILERGEEIDLGGSVMKCLYPPDDWRLRDSNSGSMVLMYENEDINVLFTGDLEFESEYELMELGDELSADVLKVAHHGSKYSGSTEFLEAVDASVAVISAGKNNSYGHPHKETLERLADSDIYITSEHGTITVYTDKSEPEIRTML
ncbi:MAG: DNA internalization-related competence protein ComEC/Rec2 [Firmicutes bacterium]|nr:DNA internalization-related competence protein ComEC/Rec2 [Bacillota bacterium]